MTDRARRPPIHTGPPDIELGSLGIYTDPPILKVGTSQILLPDKHFRLVVSLAQAPTHYRSTEELIREFWPDEPYAKKDRRHQLSVIRNETNTKLGGDYVRVVPRKGYQLVDPFDEGQHESGDGQVVGEGPDEHPPRRWTIPLIVAVAAACLLFGAVVQWWLAWEGIPALKLDAAAASNLSELPPIEDGRVRPRSNATSTGRRVVRLRSGERLEWSFTLDASGTFTPVLRYSSDHSNAPDRLRIRVDGQDAAIFPALDTRKRAERPGSGWNEFTLSPHFATEHQVILRPGRHTLSIESTDGEHGIEVDTFGLYRKWL